MTTTFTIHYATGFGQRLELVHDSGVVPLVWSEGDWWSGHTDLVGGDYSYRVVADDGVVATESGPRRTLVPVTAPTTIVDRWRDDDPTRSARASAFFSRAIAARHPADAKPVTGRVTLRLLEPAIPPGHRPALLGSSPALGEWAPDRAVPMTPAPFPWWQAALDDDGPATYKIVMLDPEGRVVRWEDGGDRVLPDVTGRVRVTDDELRGLPGFRGAGVAIPVFSLRSDRSLGVGQFTDLEPFADWAAAVGLSVIQVLPVNDSILDHTWQDSYPYNPNSVQALHPLYVDIGAIAGHGIDADLAAARRRFGAADDVDYPEVVRTKLELLRRAYANLDVALSADTEFAAFVDDEWEWLGPYSLWSVLRDRHETADFTQWGSDADFTVQRLDRASDPASTEYDELRFHWFVQYHLHRQLTAAADHARSRGVALKGDLPIGVAPESVDVWVHPELFHVGAQTGAPPDDFSTLGQNWGFPTYDWEAMAATGYRWWRDRFAALAAYVDVYRIDHVLGFFRIWEIPATADDGLLGHFRPSLPLSAGDVRAVLGDVDLAALCSPLVDEPFVRDRFGPRTESIVRRYLVESADGLVLRPEVATQRQILDLFGLEDAGEADATARGLLDIAAQVLLVAVEGGYQPRIEWQRTTHYERLDHEHQIAFDRIAIDFFHHRHRYLWRRQGETTLPAIVDATDLLTCGEDLGMVPDFVPALMNQMGLLSLEIERMPKRLGAWHADPADAPYLSVVSPGTHDTPPLRLWWRRDRANAVRVWREALDRTGEVPEDLTPDIAEMLVRRQLASPAMLAIVPFADLLAIDGELRAENFEAEWINDPSNRHNKWRYRMHLSVEDLARADRFSAWVRWMIEQSGR